MIPADAEVLGVFQPNPGDFAGGGYRPQGIPSCVRGLAIRNDGPGTLILRVGTGTGGDGGLTRTIYPYTWATMGIAVARFSLLLPAGVAPPASGAVEVVLVDKALAWAEGQLRGSEGLTLRDPVSGSKTATANTAVAYSFARESGEIMFWNDDTSNVAYLNFNGVAASGGANDLAVKPGAYVQLGVSVSSISVYGPTAYRLEVWA
jgi:hypothetical protein